MNRAWHFGFVVFCALTRFQLGFPNFRFVSPSPSLISLFLYFAIQQITRRLCLLSSVLSLIKKLSTIGQLIDGTHWTVPFKLLTL